jgi:hypothetical protein
MSPPKPEAATGLNAKLIAEFFDAGRLFTLPWLDKRGGRDAALRALSQSDFNRALKNSEVRRTLASLTRI